jgi:hypothetical protein
MRLLFTVFILLQCFFLLSCEDPSSSDPYTTTLRRYGLVTQFGCVESNNFKDMFMFEGRDAFSFGFKPFDNVYFEAEHKTSNKRTNTRGGTTYFRCKLLTMKKHK